MNVVLVHGWLSNPDQHWFPWLKRELKGRGYNVMAPAMPNPAKPNKRLWVARLKSVLAECDPQQTILIGHSLGVPTILYCLQDHDGPPFLKAVLVSGFARKIPLLGKVTDGYDMKLNLTRIKPKAESWTCIHAPNDPIVPFKEGRWMAKRLGAEFIAEKKRGHLTQYYGVVKLPSALGSIAGEMQERFNREGVMLEEVGMRLESVINAIDGFIKKTHPSLKIDPMIFLRNKILEGIKEQKARIGYIFDFWTLIFALIVCAKPPCVTWSKTAVFCWP